MEAMAEAHGAVIEAGVMEVVVMAVGAKVARVGT